MHSQSEYRGFVYIFVFFISFYFLLSSGRFFCGDEVNVYLTTQSLLTKGELSIPSVFYPTQKGRGDKFYSHKGIGLSILAVPYYLAGSFFEKILPTGIITMFAREKIGGVKDFLTGDIKIFTVSQLNAHFSALLCCMFFLLSLRFGFSIRTAVLSALILGTSTIICAYSKSFFDQTLGCLTIFTAVYFMFSPGKNLNLLLSGIFLGISAITRLENTITIPFFVCYIFAKDQVSLSKFKLSKEITVKIAIFLIPVIASLIFIKFVNFLKYGPVMQYGLPEGLGHWYSGSFLSGLYGQLFSVGKSIFIFSPPIIISTFYLKRFLYDHKLEAIFLYAVSISFIVFYSKWIGWHGGWCWGGRYLYVIIPFLLLPLGYFVENMPLRKTVWQIIILCFFVVAGFFVQILGMAPWLYDLVYDSDWNRIINNPYLDIYGNCCVFIPKVSPLLLHWKILWSGKYIDFWLYHIYKDYGLGGMLIFSFMPLAGIVVSARGIFKIVKSSVQTAGYSLPGLNRL